ncbi:YbaB/EbfC family nucleoid-associated protein [Verrucosispora sp. WMMA2044]|uniref:Nucleoid-associated protein ENC19_25005 n=1 Tax=Verrucosispora sioxanthis TaxID=2499994 RepID=A0A6M1LBU6_9ACTN|nr:MULTISPECIES: YbaB/EbfC family nucleoid-associated protein [Micromonospora]NEE66551.1 YbaB/EbfC family nucleoid-associated protein [Verrucosispora sioxanthis]NGM15661.1 YbaB/EbfC family nucleoid-associated protein [Verrucosispora sioxanthis]WBB49679.1 YbaB/EbfC family nucleoid-associated protein [Verrucosispora sp. WMMA2044]
MASNDLNQMLERARMVTEQMADMRDRLTASEVVGTSHDGTVAVTMTADAEFRDVRLDPELLERARPEEVEDLVLEALKDAGAQLRQMTEQRMGQLTEALSAFGR